MNAVTTRRSLTRARAQALAQVFFFALLLVPAFAFAADYPGKEALDFAASYVIAPLGLFAFVITIAGSFFNPMMAKQGVVVAILCAVLYFIINQGDKIFTVLGRR